VSASGKLRAAGRRALGVPDGAEVGAALQQLHDATVALQTGLESLIGQLETETARRVELGDSLAEDLAALRTVVVEQAAAIDHLQGRLTAGPGR